MRAFGYWVSVALLLYLGLSGLQGFFTDWPLVENLGQRLVGIAQVTFGLGGLSAAVGALLKKPWTGMMALVFSFGTGAAAGLAPVFWGEAGPLTGVASGGLGFLIGYLLYLGVRRAGRVDKEVDAGS